MRKPQPYGRYLLLDRIAVGGMAEVFAAKTFGVEGFERVIAIKRILPTMVEDDEFIAMFIDEARIAARLSHATIAQIYELGRHEDSYYIAMEYVSGRDVRLIIDKYKKRNQHVPLPLAAFITARLAEGLDYAHNKKDENGQPLRIIHRDVSPQNVIVSYDGEVKIIDFGIAKAAGRNQKTQAGILKGKFAYMSPEQVRGSDIDHRSDIFSAGVMLYEMVTGSKLFTGESDFSTLEKVRAGEVRAPSELNPTIPPALEQIVLKALAKDREDRYQSGAELHDELIRFAYREGEIFSTKALAGFMTTAFDEELRKENERQQHWWSTSTEETVDFEPTRTGYRIPRAKEKVRIGATDGDAIRSAETYVGVAGSDSTAVLDVASGAAVADQATQIRSVDLDGATAIVNTGDVSTSETRITQPPPPVDPGEPEIGSEGPITIPPPAPALPATPARRARRRVALAPIAITIVLLLIAAAGAVNLMYRNRHPATLVLVMSQDGHRVHHVAATLDGSPLRGQPPYSIRAPGPHTLKVTAENFEEASSTFIVPDDHRVELQMFAIPKPQPVIAVAAPDAGPAVAPPQPLPEANNREPRKSGGAPDAGTRVVERTPTPPPSTPDNNGQPPPPPVVQGTGTLSLKTNPPGAMFKLNEKAYTLRTPQMIPDVPADRPASIMFILPGYKRKVVAANVKPGGVTEVVADLQPVGSGGEQPAPPAHDDSRSSGPVADNSGPETGGPETGLIRVLCIPVSTVIIDGESTNKRTTTHPIDFPVAVGHHSVSCRIDQGKLSPPLECDIVKNSICEYRKRVEM
jgi:serine/threonine protein kinase